jgi:hypothetical protein
MVPNAVDNQVITLPTFSEVLLSVINEATCADGSDHVHIPRAAYAGHLCAERLGDLHRERTHASPRTVNQDLLPQLNLPLVAKTLQCGECRHRYRSRLLKRHVIGFHDQCRLRSTCILSKGSTARAEHLVAWFELGYVPAHRFHLAGHINAESCVLWFAQPSQYANEVRRASEEPVNWIDGKPRELLSTPHRPRRSAFQSLHI